MFSCAATLDGKDIECNDAKLADIPITEDITGLTIALSIDTDEPALPNQYTFGLQQQLCDTNGLFPASSVAAQCDNVTSSDTFCIVNEQPGAITLVSQGSAFCSVEALQYLTADDAWISCANGDCPIVAGRNAYRIILTDKINATQPIMAHLNVSNGARCVIDHLCYYIDASV